MAKKAETGTVFEFRSKLERSDNKLWGCHFPVPTAFAKALIGTDDKRVICSVNATEPYQCAILFYKKGKPVISVNKKIRDSLKLDFGSEVNVTLRKDTSEFGLPMPEELLEVFRQDAKGKQLFLSLTPGKQRTLLYIIGKVKDPQKRVDRSLVIIHHLKEQKGTIDYKKLDRSLKNSVMMSVK